jgi:hypothetical protein
VRSYRVVDYINGLTATFPTFAAASAHARLLAAKRAVALGFPVVEVEEDADGIMYAGTDGPAAPDGADREAYRALVSIEAAPLPPVDWAALLKAA